MNDRPLIKCGLCGGRGEIKIPLHCDSLNFIKNDKPLFEPTYEIIPMECPECFGHGVIEEKSATGKF